MQKGNMITLYIVSCISTDKAEDCLRHLYLCIYNSWHEDAQTFFYSAQIYSSLYVFVTRDISDFLSVTF